MSIITVISMVCSEEIIVEGGIVRFRLMVDIAKMVGWKKKYGSIEIQL